MLSSIISPQSCAQCRLCCHFERGSAWEMPYLEPSLVEDYELDGVEITPPREEGGRSFVMDFCRCAQGGSEPCPMLDPSSGCVREQQQRPFECLIWPLRVMEYEGRAAVTYFRDCPALASQEARAALRDLVIEQGLGGRIREFYDEHPRCCRQYRASYEYVGDL